MTESFSICATCGVEYTHPLPDYCPICSDERQYLPKDGRQRWTTLEELREGRTIQTFPIEPMMYGFVVDPQIGIGQRMILVQHPAGNLLFDPIPYINDASVAHIESLGGVRWIATSHPHMYGVQMEWSKAFGNAAVMVAQRDLEWLARSGDAIALWDGVLELGPGLTLHRIGGHFAGSAIVHWEAPDGKGVILAGDAILPGPDTRWVTFLRSYPNRLPLSGNVVNRISQQVLELPFDRLYSNSRDGEITSNAQEVVKRSADRYIAWVNGDFDHLT